MAEVSIAPEARADLREFRHHSERAWGRAATEIYAEGFRATFRRVAERPRIGKPEFDLAPEMRSIGYRSHRIYYRPHGEGVVIVRILHHARNIELAFPQ